MVQKLLSFEGHVFRQPYVVVSGPNGCDWLSGQVGMLGGSGLKWPEARERDRERKLKQSREGLKRKRQTN